MTNFNWPAPPIWCPSLKFEKEKQKKTQKTYSIKSMTDSGNIHEISILQIVINFNLYTLCLPFCCCCSLHHHPQQLVWLFVFHAAATNSTRTYIHTQAIRWSAAYTLRIVRGGNGGTQKVHACHPSTHHRELANWHLLGQFCWARIAVASSLRHPLATHITNQYCPFSIMSNSPCGLMYGRGKRGDIPPTHTHTATSMPHVS